MKIHRTSVFVDDQAKAEHFYTEILGFVKKHDVPVGEKDRWLTVVSPDELNDHLRTVIVAPMTTGGHAYPWRVPVTFGGKSYGLVQDLARGGTVVTPTASPTVTPTVTPTRGLTWPAARTCTTRRGCASPTPPASAAPRGCAPS